MVNYYASLGVTKDASAEDICAAFKKVAKENHPDKFPGDFEKENTFKAASEAFSVLSDKEKRAKYDRGQKPPPPPPSPFKSILMEGMSEVLGVKLSANRRRVLDGVLSGVEVASGRPPTSVDVASWLKGGIAFADLMAELSGRDQRGDRGDGT